MSITVVSGSVTARRVSWAAPLIAACVLSINSCATRKAPTEMAKTAGTTRIRANATLFSDSPSPMSQMNRRSSGT